MCCWVEGREEGADCAQLAGGEEGGGDCEALKSGEDGAVRFGNFLRGGHIGLEVGWGRAMGCVF